MSQVDDALRVHRPNANPHVVSAQVHLQRRVAAEYGVGPCPARRRYHKHMLFGIVIAVAGLGLAVSPVAVARFTNQLRFAPYSTDAARLRSYRITGVAMIALGIAIGAILS